MATTVIPVATTAIPAREHATLLERVQCLGMLAELVADAKRTGDADAELDALGYCALVLSGKATGAHVRRLGDKCRDRGKTWAAVTVIGLPTALWQHSDGFLHSADSIRLMATSRRMLLSGLSTHSNMTVLDTDHLLRNMRAMPQRYCDLAKLTVSGGDGYGSGGGGDGSGQGDGDRVRFRLELLAHVRGTFGDGGWNVRTLAVGGDMATWCAIIGCCPNIEAIELLASDKRWTPSDPWRLMCLADKCTSFAAHVSFTSGEIAVPARVTAISLRYGVDIALLDPTRVVSLTLPMHMRRDVAPVCSVARCTRLQILRFPELADAAFLGLLPCLLELSVFDFDFADGSWIPDSLKRLTAIACTVNANGLAHCLRPESKLVSIEIERVYNGDRDWDSTTDCIYRAILDALATVAKVGRVTPTLRDLVLPAMKTDASATAGGTFIQRDVDTPRDVHTAAAVLSGQDGMAFLGRDAHAFFQNRRDRCDGRLEMVVPAGLQLLLRSNPCVVSFGVPLRFQHACSKSCVHRIA